MKKWFAFVLFVCCLVPKSHAQEYRWMVGIDYFFDNQEYEPSSFTIPQTMSGVWLNTLGGISWSKSHTLYGGVNLLKIPGSADEISKVDVALYYQYEGEKTLLKAGFFPRKEVLQNYSDFFFRDSVNYYTPLMQGIFWQIGKDRNIFNAWMDWTGQATADTRESFYLGFSGKIARKALFADFQSYLFHYAGTLPGNPAYGVSEQMQLMASLGVEYNASNSFKGLFSAGVFAGIERDRKADESHSPVGFTARGEAELHGVGTKNQFYTGDRRMRLFSAHGADLYWGTPFLRGDTYLRSNWYVRLLESKYVAARINFNIHLSEGKVMTEQTFTVSASIGNFLDQGNRKTSYPWMGFFR